jgi:hypothetical protein
MVPNMTQVAGRHTGVAVLQRQPVVTVVADVPAINVVVGAVGFCPYHRYHVDLVSNLMDHSA